MREVSPRPPPPSPRAPSMVVWCLSWRLAQSSPPLRAWSSPPPAASPPEQAASPATRGLTTGNLCLAPALRSLPPGCYLCWRWQPCCYSATTLLGCHARPGQLIHELASAAAAAPLRSRTMAAPCVHIWGLGLELQIRAVERARLRCIASLCELLCLTFASAASAFRSAVPFVYRARNACLAAGLMAAMCGCLALPGRMSMLHFLSVPPSLQQVKNLAILHLLSTPLAANLATFIIVCFVEDCSSMQWDLQAFYGNSTSNTYRTRARARGNK